MFRLLHSLHRAAANQASTRHTMLKNLTSLTPSLRDTPIQHLMSLRLALIERSKSCQNGTEEFTDLSLAINKVTAQIRALGSEPTTAPRGSREVVAFYRAAVAMYWPLYRALLK